MWTLARHAGSELKIWNFHTIFVYLRAPPKTHFSPLTYLLIELSIFKDVSPYKFLIFRFYFFKNRKIIFSNRIISFFIKSAMLNPILKSEFQKSFSFIDFFQFIDFSVLNEFCVGGLYVCAALPLCIPRITSTPHTARTQLGACGRLWFHIGALAQRYIVQDYKGSGPGFDPRQHLYFCTFLEPKFLQ